MQSDAAGRRSRPGREGERVRRQTSRKPSGLSSDPLASRRRFAAPRRIGVCQSVLRDLSVNPAPCPPFLRGERAS